MASQRQSHVHGRGTQLPRIAQHSKVNETVQFLFNELQSVRAQVAAAVRIGQKTTNVELLQREQELWQSYRPQLVLNRETGPPWIAYAAILETRSLWKSLAFASPTLSRSA